MTSILPPNASRLDRVVEEAIATRLDDVPVAIDRIWNPATCPAQLLPWLAWGLSLDLWNANWTEAQKRAAVADAIRFQQRKGTPASLRTVLDRFDPMIGIMEWFQDRDTLDPYTFRLEMPLRADSDVIYDDALVEQIMRDIAQVKPVRAHMTAVFKLVAEARAWLLSAAALAGQRRLAIPVDAVAATDPVWNSYLQTEDGEPLLTEAGAFLEEQH
jgi:phage tail P2-like protein